MIVEILTIIDPVDKKMIYEGNLERDGERYRYRNATLGELVVYQDPITKKHYGRPVTKLVNEQVIERYVYGINARIRRKLNSRNLSEKLRQIANELKAVLQDAGCTVGNLFISLQT